MEVLTEEGNTAPARCRSSRWKTPATTPNMRFGRRLGPRRPDHRRRREPGAGRPPSPATSCKANSDGFRLGALIGDPTGFDPDAALSRRVRARRTGCPHWNAPPRPEYLRWRAPPRTPRPVADTGWHPAVLLGAWTAAGSPWQPPRYRKLPTGQVEIQGVASNGTANPIFVLPPGYRPARRLLVPTTRVTRSAGSTSPRTAPSYAARAPPPGSPSTPPSPPTNNPTSTGVRPLLTITAYPFENQDTTEAQYSRLFRELQDSGVAGHPGRHRLRRLGERLRHGSPRRSPASRSCAATPCPPTPPKPSPSPPPTSTARIDRVVLRLDAAQDTITPAVIQGLAGGAGPAAHAAPTPGIFEVPLALVTVGPGVASIAADKVTDDRQYIGSRVGIWTTPTRPTGQRQGKLGLNATTNRWEFWDGDAWTDLAPVGEPGRRSAGKPAAFPPSCTPPRMERPGQRAQLVHPGRAHPRLRRRSPTSRRRSRPTAHGHSGADITTGTVPIARLPTGTGATKSRSATTATPTPRPTTPTPPWRPRRVPDGTDGAHAREASGSGNWYSVWVDGTKTFCRNTSSIRYKTNVRDHDIDPADVLALAAPSVRPAGHTDDDGCHPGRRTSTA